MPVYSYTVADYTGQKINGRMEAKDKTTVINNLRKSQLIIISLRELKEKEVKALKRGGKLRLEELLVFFRQLTALVRAGIPLVKSLNIIFSQAENPFLKEIVSSLISQIESGTSLSEAMSAYSQVFLPLYTNMIKAGEMSGALDTILERLALYLEASSKLNRKVQSAMMYPIAVISIAVLITVGIFIFVIPKFKEMFSSMGGNLPLPTQIVIGISEGLGKYFLVLIILIVILAIALRKALDTPRARLRWDKMKLDLPMMGKLIRKVIVARFARTTATLLRSGVSILTALDIGAKTSGNKTVEVTLTKVIARVSKGERIGDVLAENKVFAPFVVNLISVGEETGDLSGMLDKIAYFYEEEVDAAVSGLTSLIEPLIIVVLGVLIGGIVISLFLPIFRLSQIMGR